jgi:hypothetical protein
MTKLPESVHEPSENLRLVEINMGPKLVLKNRFLGHFERVLFLTGKQLWSMGAKANLSNPFTLGLFSYRDTGHSVTAIQTHGEKGTACVFCSNMPGRLHVQFCHHDPPGFTSWWRTQFTHPSL